jgi:hypothetical protein
VATANDIGSAVCGTTFIGSGAAMHQLAWSSLGEIVPTKSRPMALGSLQSSLAIFGALGPLIGKSHCISEDL